MGQRKFRMNGKRWLLTLIVFVALAVPFLYFENNAITTTSFRIESGKLPSGFDSYRIVQLSDVHSKLFGDRQGRLVRKVAKLEPNLIVVTGDLVDARRYNAENSLILMRELTALAPVYYVTGNHESRSGRYEELEEGLTRLGVHVMRNASERIKLGDGYIRLAGVDDPTFNRQSFTNSGSVEEGIRQALDGADREEEYTILLSHRPELFEVYAYNGIDLAFSGHAHGGQVRLPFLGGLIAPNQGLLPKYDGGKYESGGTTMIVSRGLGNSIAPQRLFNRPELVLVELTRGG